MQTTGTTTTTGEPMKTGRFSRQQPPEAPASAARSQEAVLARHREAAVVSWMRSLGRRPPGPRP